MTFTRTLSSISMASLAPGLGCLLLCACNKPDDGGPGDGSSSGGEPTTTTTTTDVPTSTDAPTNATTGPGEPTTSPTGETDSGSDSTTGDVLPCDPGPRVSTDEVLTAIAHDLDGAAVGVEAFPFTRYLSFVHLANAGLCDEEIEVHRQAVAKLVNSLSQEVLVRPPVAIDERRLLLRIDIRDYAWSSGPVQLSAPSFYFRDSDSQTISPAEQAELDKVFADKWEMIADQNPYSVSHIGEQALLIASDTHTKFPILQGDAFVDVASRAPLYYDILGIPLRAGRLAPSHPPCDGDECLESQLGLDLLGDLASELVDDDDVMDRAGLHVSDISEFNRVIERHRFVDANNRSMWIAYDFRSQVDVRNIDKHPLDFEFDQTALLYSLPNGFQAYMLADEDGRRIDEAGVEILQDPSQKDAIDRSAVSCMGCHSVGIIRAQDDIRFDLDNGQSEEVYTAEQKDQIRALYPSREDLDDLQTEDIARFVAALEACGLDPEPASEPVLTTFLAFDEDLAIQRAAAELDLLQEDLQLLIGKLSPDLLELGKGGTVQRGDFTVNFAASVCLLDLGLTRCCPLDTQVLEPGCDP